MPCTPERCTECAKQLRRSGLQKNVQKNVTGHCRSTCDKCCRKAPRDRDNLLWCVYLTSHIYPSNHPSFFSTHALRTSTHKPPHTNRARVSPVLPRNASNSSMSAMVRAVLSSAGGDVPTDMHVAARKSKRTHLKRTCTS